MNFKTTIYLFAAVFVVILGLVVATFTGSKKAEEGRLLRGVEAKDVTRLTVERHQPAENKLVFAKTGENQWKLEEPYAARVDGRQVDSVVTALTSATAVTKGADLTSNPAQFGLDHPSLSVTLDAGGKTTTVNFGKVTIGTGEHALVYVNTSANKAPTAVRRSSVSALFRDVPDAQTAGDLFKNVGEYRSRDLL